MENWPIVAAARRLPGLLAALAMLSAVLFVTTLFVPDWIEAVFRIDPDAQSGSLEAAIVTALAATTVVSSVLARREWRRPKVGGPRGEVT